MAFAVVVLVGERGEGAVDRGQDLGQRDLLRRASEHVAAADAAFGSYESCAFDREEDLLQVRLGEVRALCDFLDRGRSVGAVEGQRQQRPGGVIAAGGDLHPAMLPHRGFLPAPLAPAHCYGAAVAPEEPIRPDYGGRSLEQVVPALVGRVDQAWLPDAAREAQTVVLLVLDGLGWELLQSHATELPELGALDGGPITTVAPSTTACALTSITTGLSPIQHGVLGYRMRLDGSVLNVLRWTIDGGARPPDAFDVQRHQPFLGRTVPVVTKSEFRTSGFSAAHLRDAPFFGWSTPTMLVERCRALARAGHPLIYAYYPGVDTVAHEYGLAPPYLAAELRFVDEMVGRLRDALPPEAALLVTADHGEMEIGDRWLELTAVQDLVKGCSGEGRFRWLNSVRGGANELADAARAAYGADAWVMTREEVVDGGWLGPGPVPVANLRRLGDVLLAARTSVGFIDPALPRERQLVGAHGSLTAAEMFVPLVAGPGRG